MSSWFHGAFVLAALTSLPEVGAPKTLRLTHGAPRLGHELALQLSGAPPGASIVLLASSRAGDAASPRGRIELDLERASAIAAGRADAGGRWSFAKELASDPGWAEAQVHVQALAFEPGCEQPLISGALHLRLLDTRAYVTCTGRPWVGHYPITGALEIVSLTRAEVVARVEYDFVDLDAPDASAQPVFDPSFSRGAIMASGQYLIVFEPFFGRVVARAHVPQSARKLLVDATGTRVAVLTPGEFQGGAPAQVRVFDLGSGELRAQLDLPHEDFSGLWASSSDGRIAYVAGYDRNSAQTFVERIDLTTASDLGRVVVGGPSSRSIGSLCATGDELLVLAHRLVAFCTLEAQLSRLVETPAGPSVATSPFTTGATDLRWDPALDLLHFNAGPYCAPGRDIGLLRAGDPLGAAEYFGNHFDVVREVAPTPSGLWVHAYSGNGNDELWFADYLHEQWAASTFHDPAQVAAIAAVSDAWGEHRLAATREFVAGTFVRRAQLYVVDGR
jgi:hypothetical protein